MTRLGDHPSRDSKPGHISRAQVCSPHDIKHAIRKLRISEWYFILAYLYILNHTGRIWEFPGGPVVRIPSFPHHGRGSIPGQRTEIPTSHKVCLKKKKKKCEAGRGDFR